MTTRTERHYAARDLALPVLLAAALVALSRVSFLWFHTFAELFAIVVGVSLYVVARASYGFNRNGFLLFLAQGFFWAACIDAIHTMSYSGMGLLADNDPNPATQLWLLARLLEAVTLALAPRYLDEGRRLDRSFAVMGLAAAAGAIAVFAGAFPDAFVAGRGLTPFKIAVEYTIIGILLIAAGRLYAIRRLIDEALFRVLTAVILLTIVSEFAFTLYVSVYGLSNLVGHIAKLWAFWLLLSAIARWMLAQPFRLLSRDATSFDAVPVPVLVLDRDGVIQSCNEAARQRRADGGIGLPLHEAWHPAALADCPVCAARVDGREVAADVHDPDRDEWTSVRLQPVRGGDAIGGFIAVHIDITERKRAERRLVDAEKMEAIGQLTGGLAHDFNNLLGIVIGGLDMLGPQTDGDPKAQRLRDLALRAAHRAADVTKSLLAVARKQPLSPVPVDIDEALTEMMPLLRQSAGGAIEINDVRCDECRSGRIRALVDTAGLGNALLNLVINARDAMPDGGRLLIETELRRVTADEVGAPTGLVPGLYVQTSVSDTGSGIAPEVMAHIFEPFFTTKEKGKGTGLGLAMVYGFARQSGGTATVYSEPGVGTTFRLYVPATLDGTPSRAAADVAPPVNGERVLVVDDEVDLRELTCGWLRELGYRVVGVDSPPRALAALDEADFDLLLTDVVMPGSTGGLALAARVATRVVAPRILLCSGFAGGAATDPWPLLQKPYGRDDLARAVRRVLADNKGEK